jgi:NitT/TauT family transport system permease protein
MALSKRLFAQANIWIRPNIWDAVALILVLSVLVLISYGGAKMSLPFHLGQVIPISLAYKNLPFYALETVLRMFIALLLSLLFTFTIGTLAAKSERAGKILIPVIDILQSVPILGYLSITVVGFISLFPNSMIGPECAAIFAVFTSQVWNMTLSFYQSLRTVPSELVEAARMYHLNGWQRFWRLEVPFAIPGLLWNAMLSMSGGWFFIVAAEAISVANQYITLPGIGSYIALAISEKNGTAIFGAIATMFLVILIYDQLMFRPLVAWSHKFRLTDIPDEESESWILNLLLRSELMVMIGRKIKNVWFIFTQLNLGHAHVYPTTFNSTQKRIKDIFWYGAVVILVIVAGYYLAHFIYKGVPLKETLYVFMLGSFTALRVFVLILLCSCIWVPIGVYIGLRPKLARIIQPIAQFFAAFPANLFFPIFVIFILKFNLNVEIWTAPLMVLGTQWYILFNVIAGAMTIPKELKLAIENMHLSGLLKWRRFLIPAIFPYYVTGAITASGGSWNASIVAEVVSWGHTTLIAHGLGAYITENTVSGNFEEVALGVVVMCLWVTMINLLFWRRLYRYAEERFAL